MNINQEDIDFYDHQLLYQEYLSKHKRRYKRQNKRDDRAKPRSRSKRVRADFSGDDIDHKYYAKHNGDIIYTAKKSLNESVHPEKIPLANTSLKENAPPHEDPSICSTYLTPTKKPCENVSNYSRLKREDSTKITKDTSTFYPNTIDSNYPPSHIKTLSFDQQNFQGEALFRNSPEQTSHNFIIL